MKWLLESYIRQVNTAARMESNGIKNKIHISESTAQLLRESGKGSWLVPRDELIEAKGKGKMQTYVSPVFQPCCIFFSS